MTDQTRWPIRTVAVCLSLAFPCGAFAQPTSSDSAGNKTLRQLPEAAEMLLAIARGSNMGPGDGWFHPGQSRFGWQWLKENCSPGMSSTIRAQNFRGPKALFDRLDRNRD